MITRKDPTVVELAPKTGSPIIAKKQKGESSSERGASMGGTWGHQMSIDVFHATVEQIMS